MRRNTCFKSEAGYSDERPPVAPTPVWSSARVLGGRGGLPLGVWGSHCPAKLAVDWPSWPLGVGWTKSKSTENVVLAIGSDVNDENMQQPMITQMDKQLYLATHYIYERQDLQACLEN